MYFYPAFTYVNYYTELREGGSYRCQINQTLKLQK